MASLEIKISKFTFSINLEKKVKNSLRLGEFYYDQPGSKWGGRDVSKNEAVVNDKNGNGTKLTSSEFLATELDWRARPANNNLKDQTLARDEIGAKNAQKVQSKRIKLF